MELTATHLLSIPNCTLTHLANGDREPLGHGTLSLHLIDVPAPTHHAAADTKLPGYSVEAPASGGPGAEGGTEECLLLSLASGGPAGQAGVGGVAGKATFELPVKQGTHVVASAGGGYFIPFNGGFDAAAGSETDGPGFVEVTLPDGISLEERDTLEAILSDMTSFTPPPHQPAPVPLSTSPAEASLRNQLVLMNDAGEVVGTLADDHAVAEDGTLFDADQPGALSQNPVVIESSPSGLRATSWVPVDNPTNSSLISAANFVSSGVVVGAEWAARKLEDAAGRQLAGESRLAGGRHKELVFHPIAGRGAAAGLKVTQGVLTVTGKTVGLIGSAAAGVGDRLGRTLGIQSSPSGKPPKGIRGVVNRALVAANSVVDSLEQGGSAVLASGSHSANAVIGHHYGPEAAKVSAQVGGSVKHVALVYIDVRGIQRRALLKTVGRSALKAKMTDGTEVVLEPSTEEELEAIGAGQAGGVARTGAVGTGKAGSVSGAPPPLPARVEPSAAGAGEKVAAAAPALPPRANSPLPPPVPSRPAKN